MTDNFPPVQEGYVRIFTDHTGRWYQDYSQSDIDAMANDPLTVVLQTEIQKEIDKEILNLFNKNKL